MISILMSLRFWLRGALASGLLLLCCAASNSSLAQSIDVRSPTPIRTNEVMGAIGARDLGDSRLTNHFYVFTGTPGDVLVTVKSNNLNGDVDLFTSGNLRPLMKFSLYAENSSPATRSVFLRKNEDLILRIEARSPNDDEGTYQITLGGSFQPIAGEDRVADADSSTAESASTVDSRSKGSRRVSSVGARIDEPAAAREEVVSAPTPQPTPEEAARTPTPEPTVTSETPTSPSTADPAPPARRGRGRVPPVRRRPAPPAKKGEPAVAEATNEEKAAETPKTDTAVTEAPTPPPRRSGRRAAVEKPAEQIPVQEPQYGPRLVIQMHDGTLIERFMSTIKRVTVENNQIVVVKKDGKIERTRLSEVLRMAIEP